MLTFAANITADKSSLNLFSFYIQKRNHQWSLDYEAWPLILPHGNMWGSSKLSAPKTRVACSKPGAFGVLTREEKNEMKKNNVCGWQLCGPPKIKMLVTDPNTGNIYVVNVSETHPSTKRYFYFFLCWQNRHSYHSRETLLLLHAEEGGGWGWLLQFA